MPIGIKMIDPMQTAAQATPIFHTQVFLEGMDMPDTKSTTPNNMIKILDVMRSADNMNVVAVYIFIWLEYWQANRKPASQTAHPANKCNDMSIFRCTDIMTFKNQW